MIYHSLRFKVIFTLTIALYSYNLSGQDTPIRDTSRDSIISTLKNFKSRDSIRVEKLINTAHSIIENNPSLSLELIEEALEISKSIKWEKGIALSLRQKGLYYYRVSDNLSALELFQEALKLDFTKNNTQLKTSLYNNIGNIYADLEEYESALENYENLLSNSYEQSNTQFTLIALTNVGSIYTEMGKYDESILKLKEALELAENLNDNYFIGAISNNLGIPYKRKKDYQSGLYYYKKAYDYGSKIGNKYLKSTAANNISEIELLNNNYETSIFYAKESLKLSTQIDAVEWQSDSWELLYKAYEGLQQNNKALEAYKKHIMLKDSIYGKEKTAEIVRKGAEFEAEKQRAIEKNKQDKQKLINKVLAFSIVGIIMAVITISFFYRRKQAAISIAKENSFKAKVAQLELKALKAQMNPHFLFNALTSVGNYILQNDTEAANDYLSKYAVLMRKTLESSNKELISLDNEIILLKTYLDIEKKRFHNKFKYKIQVSDSIDTEITLVPTLILQPFIENSIIHGIANMQGEGLIVLEFSEANNNLICTVDDNGIGRKASAKKSEYKKESLGIDITINRINLINKNSRNNVKIIDKDIGTRVEVVLPLELDI